MALVDSITVHPATPEEQAEILEALQLATVQDQLATPETSVHRAYQATARRIEGERLEAFHEQPLPPGYAVVTMTDAYGRELYALRLPDGVEQQITVVSENIRVVLADAWNEHLSRIPDGLPQDTVTRMLESPPVSPSYLWRTLWEVALHHRAAHVTDAAMPLAHAHPSWGATRREAQSRVLQELMIASASLSARRAGRLAELLGLWDHEDPDRATQLYLEDRNWVAPWVGLFDKCAARVDSNAHRWWYRQVVSTTTSPQSFEEAEARITPALQQAWAATYLMTMACAVELADSTGEPARYTEQTLREGMHTSGRMQSLGLLPDTITQEPEAIRWCKRSLKKGAPRLFKILSTRFPNFGRRCPEVSG